MLRNVRRLIGGEEDDRETRAHALITDRRFVFGTFLFSIASAVLLLSCAFYYLPMGSDGGWYSYPGLALSRGGDPAENTFDVPVLEKIDGIKAAFPFQTYSSIRAYYTKYWFTLFQGDIVSLKSLALLEYFLLVVGAFILFSKQIGDRLIALLFFSIFLNDKSLLVSATSDFRPDIILTLFAVLAFLFVVPRVRKTDVVFFAFIIALLLTHLTAVIAIFFFCLYLLFCAIIEKKNYIANSLMIACMSIVTILIFFWRDDLFDILMPSQIGMGEAISFATGRMDHLFAGGIPMILLKEYLRWTDYFFYSNIVMLFLYGVLSILMIRGYLKGEIPLGRSFALLLAGVVTAISLSVIDPHSSSSHLFPLVPFFMLSMGQIYREHLANLLKIRVLAVLVLLNSLSTVALAANIFLDGKYSNFNIGTIGNYVNEKMANQKKDFLIVGPTEIWPFLDGGNRVLIFDMTRNGENFDRLDVAVQKADYVILNNDYERFGWRRKFEARYPRLLLEEVDSVKKKKESIRTYVIRKR